MFRDDKLIFDIYEKYKDNIATLETKLAQIEPRSANQPNGQADNGKSYSRKDSPRTAAEEKKMDL